MTTDYIRSSRALPQRSAAPQGRHFKNSFTIYHALNPHTRQRDSGWMTAGAIHYTSSLSNTSGRAVRGTDDSASLSASSGRPPGAVAKALPLLDIAKLQQIIHSYAGTTEAKTQVDVFTMALRQAVGIIQTDRCRRGERVQSDCDGDNQQETYEELEEREGRCWRDKACATLQTS